MKIKIGEWYTAIVNRKNAIVRVEEITSYPTTPCSRDITGKLRKNLYVVTNIYTGRRLEFKSESRFLKHVGQPRPCAGVGG